MILFLVLKINSNWTDNGRYSSHLCICQWEPIAEEDFGYDIKDDPKGITDTVEVDRFEEMIVTNPSDTREKLLS